MSDDTLDARIGEVLDANPTTDEDRRQVRLLQAFLADPRVAGNTSGEHLPAQVFVDHAEALGVAGAELEQVRAAAAAQRPQEAL